MLATGAEPSLPPGHQVNGRQRRNPIEKEAVFDDAATARAYLEAQARRVTHNPRVVLEWRAIPLKSIVSRQ